MTSQADKVVLVNAEEVHPVQQAWGQPPAYPAPMHVYTAGYQQGVETTGTRSPAVNSGLHGCGAVQIAIGVISFFIGILELCMGIVNYNFYNFWCPLWLILAGAFAVAAVRRRMSGKGFIVTSMVFSIISSISTFVSLMIAATYAVSIGTFHENLCQQFTKMNVQLNGLPSDDEINHSSRAVASDVVENMRFITCDRHTFMVTLLVIDTILFLTAFITSIVQSAFCCKATCCARRNNRAF